METTTLTKSNWQVDPAHSELSFTVKHLMISKVKGHFRDFKAEIGSQDDEFTAAHVTATINSASVDTGDVQRDGHLKGADFFDAENYPEIKFVSTGFDKISRTNYELKGDLTIRGITKPVKFDVEFGGIAKDPWGNTKAGFSLTGKINRKDWDLNWNAALEAGGVLVSDEVRVAAEIQISKH